VTSPEHASLNSEPPPLVAGSVITAWRGVTRAHVKAAFLFGCAATLFHVVVWSWGMLNRPGLLYPLLTTFVNDQIGAFALMLSIVVADRVSAKHPGRRAPYVIAVVAGAALATPLESILGSWLVEPVFLWKQVLQNALYFFFDWLVLAGTATFVYIDRRRARGALARMHDARMERARSARRTLESRLQAMQARVEPQFLFNTLERVRDLYRKDAHRGQRTLDELIAYLHAAMPHMRDSSSSVRQELELVRSYLGIERLRAGDRLTVEIDAEPQVADARMPPMMLLPLVDLALARASLDSASGASLRIRATRVGGKVRVVLQCSAQNSRSPASDNLAGLRERLAALYGVEARLVVHAQDDVAVETLLEVPCDAAVPSDSMEHRLFPPRRGVTSQR
jgi:hypothetical protein